ncbi:MAG: hypothetical protein AB7I59_01735 [Geminicoccaceae bacterium]
MRKLQVPQAYVTAIAGEAGDLRVIAVKPTGSDEAAFASVFGTAIECGRSFAALAAAAPHLAAVLCQLIDELDGLAYRHHQEGLLPLAGEPFWNQLPWEWPDADADGRPGFEAVAEWLNWITRDAQDLWGGLVVTTDRGNWRFGDPRPVRTILAGATQCRITRQADGPEVLELILSRLPPEQAEQLRQQIAAIREVDALATPLIAGEVRELIRLKRREDELAAAAAARDRREPPPVSRQPLTAIALTPLLHPDTPNDPDELTSEIEHHNARLQSFRLLQPIGDPAAALDACLPPGSMARGLLDQVAVTAPELHALALNIADHLDGLGRAYERGIVPVAGIVLHDALGELLRDTSEDPWEQAVTFYRGLWLAVGYHLVRVQLETANGGIWNTSRPPRLRDVLAGQSHCTIARPEEIDGYGHACMDLPISEELRVRWHSSF